MAQTKGKAGSSENGTGDTESREIKIHAATYHYVKVSRSFEEIAKAVDIPQATIESWSKTAEWQHLLKFWGFTGQKPSTQRKVKMPPPEVPHTLTERYLLKEGFQADGDVIRFVTYNGFMDSNVEEVETYHLVLSDGQILNKHNILLAFPKSKMADLKRNIKRRKEIADYNLRPIVPKRYSPAVPIRAKIGSPIECIMRNGLVIRGRNLWISKYNIVLRIGDIKGKSRGKVALIYKHGLLKFRRFESKSFVTADPKDGKDDWGDE